MAPPGSPGGRLERARPATLALLLATGVVLLLLAALTTWNTVHLSALQSAVHLPSAGLLHLSAQAPAQISSQPVLKTVPHVLAHAGLELPPRLADLAAKPGNGNGLSHALKKAQEALAQHLKRMAESAGSQSIVSPIPPIIHQVGA